MDLCVMHGIDVHTKFEKMWQFEIQQNQCVSDKIDQLNGIFSPLASNEVRNYH